MNPRLSAFIRGGILLFLVAGSAAQAQEVPPHPRELKYPALAFHPPKRADHRAVLPNGLRVYLVPDRAVPALHVEAWIDAGEMWLPKERRGLAKLAGMLMRTGGVEEIDARALDARLDAIAAEIDVEIGLERGRASLWTLSMHAGEALDLFAKVLTRPVFAEDRIRRAKDELRTEIAHRDDDPERQLDQKVREVVYGKESRLALRETEATVDALTRDHLLEFHRSRVAPETVILAVSGDFDRAAMLGRVEKLFGSWKPAAEPERGVPEVAARPHGVFLLDRADVNQGFVEIAQAGVALGHPDEVPLQVLNFIFGGGSFTSRITKRVRNDEGLAYSAGCYVRPGRGYPGIHAMYFQSKAESVTRAAEICFEELKRIREEPVPAEEIERARSSLRDRFPERFATAHGAAAALAEAELLGRPADWYETYRDKVAAVAAEDVRRVARAHFVPERLSLVVVGPAASLREPLAAFGKVEALAAD